MLKEGYWYVLPLGLIAVGCLALGLWMAAGFFLLLALFVLNFFRDPERPLPDDPDAMVSPADGRVVQIAEERIAGRDVRRVSIFMSPLDVHVNRSPFGGRIAEVVYRKGRFGVASAARASAENEQNIFTIESAAGTILVRQVAGLLARRIVFWKQVGDRVERGERVGLIKFGSRVDVLLDCGIDLRVKVGQHVRAGSSVLALAGTGQNTGEHGSADSAQAVGRLQR